MTKALDLPSRVTIEEIDEQRRKGWTDFHPEDYCHRCGNRNIPSWHVDSDRFNTALGPYLTQPYNGIICPTCFVLLHEEVTGLTTTWYLLPLQGQWFRPIQIKGE